MPTCVGVCKCLEKGDRGIRLRGLILFTQFVDTKRSAVAVDKRFASIANAIFPARLEEH